MVMDSALRAKFYADWAQDGLEAATAFLRQRGISEGELSTLLVCPVHGTSLRLGKARIRYMGRPSDEFEKKMRTENERLPFKQTFKLGAIMRPEGKPRPRFTSVVYCQDCRIAGSWWRSWIANMLRPR